MKPAVCIVDVEKYNSTVIEVDVSGLKSTASGYWRGVVEIETEADGQRIFDGEHGLRDFVEEFGFSIAECRYFQNIETASTVCLFPSASLDRSTPGLLAWTDAHGEQYGPWGFTPDGYKSVPTEYVLKPEY